MHEAVGENVLAGPIMAAPIAVPVRAAAAVRTRRARSTPGSARPPARHSRPRRPDRDDRRDRRPNSTSTASASSSRTRRTPKHRPEMNFFFPDKRLLCMAENCTHTLHNLYPIRGAQVPATRWRGASTSTRRCGCGATHTDTMFASHHWPRFGGDDVAGVPHTAARRVPLDPRPDAAARQPRPHPDEIAAELSSCPSASRTSRTCRATTARCRTTSGRSTTATSAGTTATRPTSTRSHRSRPARSYVELMGGPDAVLRGARAAFDDGDYRWVVEVLNHLVFADPEHREARALLGPTRWSSSATRPSRRPGATPT
jgi:hypothetical protein